MYALICKNGCVVKNDCNISNDDWRGRINQSQRKHLVDRLISAIVPQGINEPGTTKTNKWKNLISNVQKAEEELYSSAASKEDYFHLLADKVHNIQTELEDKRNERQRYVKEAMKRDAEGQR
ncbi:protein cbp-1-like [Clytia hemisphaerica]